MTHFVRIQLQNRNWNLGPFTSKDSAKEYADLLVEADPSVIAVPRTTMKNMTGLLLDPFQFMRKQGYIL